MNSALIEKIHSTGYWRVNFRPIQFKKDLVSTLAECKELVRDSIVSLRGWDYPHWDREESGNGQDWVESGCDWMSHIEYWRFYQSGQFIHHSALHEDHDYSDKNILSIVSTVYLMTEIFEFAARLSAKGIYAEGVEVSISLHNTQDRKLTILDPRRAPLHDEYICKIGTILFQRTVSQDEILGKSRRLALDTIEYIFERFNWTNIPKHVMAEDQAKLLERRL